MPGSKNQRRFAAGGSPHAAPIIPHKHDPASERLRPWQCHTISKRHRAQTPNVTSPIILSHENPIPTSIPAWSDWTLLLISGPCNTSHCSIVAPVDSALHHAVFIFPFHVCILFLHQLILGMRKHYTELTWLSNYLACVRN